MKSKRQSLYSTPSIKPPQTRDSSLSLRDIAGSPRSCQKSVEDGKKLSNLCRPTPMSQRERVRYYDSENPRIGRWISHHKTRAEGENVKQKATTDPKAQKNGHTSQNPRAVAFGNKGNVRLIQRDSDSGFNGRVRKIEKKGFRSSPSAPLQILRFSPKIFRESMR
jgi:hypothetical protein